MKSAPIISSGLVAQNVRWLALAAVAMAAVFLAVWISASSVSAQANTVGVDHDGAPADMNAGPALAAPGNSVTISIVADAPVGGLGSWTLNVMYDPAMFTPTGCTAFGDSSACNLAFSSTQVRFVGTSVSGAVGVFSMASFTFQAIGALADCSAITPTVVTWTDPAGTNLVRPSVANGQMCIGVPATPTPSPVPTPSPTPSPTDSPTPSPTPAPTKEPTPTASPAPTKEPTPTPSAKTCDGLPATVIGTDSGEWIFGTRGDDVIVALGGNDVVFGLGGNDRICLGNGNDAAYAGGGDDRVLGEDGNDIIFGERGNDFMDGGNGWDWCFGGHGFDTAMNCKGGSWWRWGRWH